MSTDYYKVVRPDLSSFHDHAFEWPLHGIVEVPGAVKGGPCGIGLHLAKSINNGITYAQFPFRVLSVRPLSPILGEDDTKIRVARAETLGEIEKPRWVQNTEKCIEGLLAEMASIPWFKCTQPEKAKRLIREHFRLLTSFGFNLKFKIEIIHDWAAVWDAVRDASKDDTWAAVWDAAGVARKQLNPFKPLWDCWRLGAWPIGLVNGTFKIFMEKL